LQYRRLETPEAYQYKTSEAVECASRALQAQHHAGILARGLCRRLWSTRPYGA